MSFLHSNDLVYGKKKVMTEAFINPSFHNPPFIRHLFSVFFRDRDGSNAQYRMRKSNKRTASFLPANAPSPNNEKHPIPRTEDHSTHITQKGSPAVK